MLNINILDKLMKEKELKSIKELSNKSHIPYTTLIHVFNGNDLLVGTLIELAKFFEVTCDELVCKDYEFVTYNNSYTVKHKTTNIYEITVSKIFNSFANYMFK